MCKVLQDNPITVSRIWQNLAVEAALGKILLVFLQHLAAFGR